MTTVRLFLPCLAMATAFHAPAQHSFVSRLAVRSAPQVLENSGILVNG